MRYILFVAAVLLSISQFSFAKSQQIPLQHFYQLPMVQNPVISPDGKNIAVILNQDGLTQVAIVDFNDHSKVNVILQLGAEKYRIDELNWANNERVLVTVSQPMKVDRYRLRSTHLYSASLDGKDVFELRKRGKRRESALEFYYASPSLLSLLQDDPEHILVTQNDPRDKNYSSVFKVNVKNGDFEKYLPNGKRIVSWGVSPSGEILLAVGVDSDPDKDINYIYTRKDSRSDWLLVKTREAFKDETFGVISYLPEEDSIIVLSDYVEDDTKPRKTSLWKYSIAENKFTELLGQAPGQYDVTGAISRLEGKTRKVIGFTYNDGFLKRQYFNPTSQSISVQISNLFKQKGLQASLWDWDSTKSRYIVKTVSDKKPINYFLYDKSKNKLTPWYGQYPVLSKTNLNDVMPITFKARDGMQLHGYLTLPTHVQNAPVVLFPHGGPYARDSQYFDPFVQMFASRGYAVLQVNYRGSTGYGTDYQTAGYLEWGKKMQTDLIDGLDWLESKQLANTKQACIVGASYGGYAALVAGFQTPDRFKCIVSIAGVSDLTKQVSDWRMKGLKNYVENAVSSIKSEQISVSPIYHVEKFKAPVLLIHGKVDTRVSYYQSELMYDALKNADKEVDYELFDWGTHHLNDAGNRQRAMELMESFLQEHL
ncbi:alpha/beta fold hydrolase [Thalassotalea ganghwensis]